MKSNLNLRTQDVNFLTTKNQVLAAKGQLLPSVDLSASASRSNGSTENNFQKTTTKNTYSTGISLTIPIIQAGGAQHSKIRQAKAQLRQAVYSKDYLKKSIKTQLIQNWEQYIAAKQSLVFTKEAIEAKQMELDGIKSMFNVGVKTMLDVLTVEKEFYDVVVQNITAKEQMIKIAFTIKSDLAQLTAKDLALTAKLFDPEAEFRKTKFKILGF